MGAYYFTVCPTKRQYLHPHIFNSGMKLLEFGSDGLSVMTALAVLLADGNGRGGGDLRSASPLIGTWAGEPVIVASDYADPGKFVSKADLAAYRKHVSQDRDFMADLKVSRKKLSQVTPNLYGVASAIYEDISEKIILVLCDDPYIRKALQDRGVEAAKAWQQADPFSLE